MHPTAAGTQNFDITLAYNGKTVTKTVQVTVAEGAGNSLFNGLGNTTTLFIIAAVLIILIIVIIVLIIRVSSKRQKPEY